MEQRGRKSASSLEVVAPVVRRDPPLELREDERHEWIEIVNRLPAYWFEEGVQATLVQYCRHVVQARKVAQLIRQHEEGGYFDIKEYDTLLKMADRESKAITMLARSMRLTQQATLDPERRKAQKRLAKNPWD